MKVLRFSVQFRWSSYR